MILPVLLLVFVGIACAPYIIPRRRNPMSLFGALIRTAVNVATLPFSVAADVVTLGGQINNPGGQSYTGKTIEKLKYEAYSD